MRPDGSVTITGARIAAELLATGRSTIRQDAGLDGRIADAYAAFESFFALPDRERGLCTLPFGCGWRPFGSEHSGGASNLDQVDCFAASARTRHEGARLPVPAASALHEAMMIVFDTLSEVAAKVVDDLAASLTEGKRLDHLGGGLIRWSVLEIHRARPLAAGAVINATHEDGHLLTLSHATAPGLELAVGGEFVPAEHAALSVLPGSALTLLSGGEVHPMHHRVVAWPAVRARLSLLFFADLDPRLCSPWRTGPDNAGIDIAAHVLGNSARFGTEGFTLE